MNARRVAKEYEAVTRLSTTYRVLLSSQTQGAEQDESKCAAYRKSRRIKAGELDFLSPYRYNILA